jgi:hypothetical protein
LKGNTVRPAGLKTGGALDKPLLYNEFSLFFASSEK